MLLLFSMALEQCLTGLFSSLSSMTQPDFAVVSFPDFFVFFVFYNRVDSNHGHTKCVHLIFIPYFLMGLIDFLPKNKHGQEQLVF